MYRIQILTFSSCRSLIETFYTSDAMAMTLKEHSQLSQEAPYTQKNGEKGRQRRFTSQQVLLCDAITLTSKNIKKKKQRKFIVKSFPIFMVHNIDFKTEKSH